jgi:hypothetical protein
MKDDERKLREVVERCGRLLQATTDLRIRDVLHGSIWEAEARLAARLAWEKRDGIFDSPSL